MYPADTPWLLGMLDEWWQGLFFAGTSRTGYDAKEVEWLLMKRLPGCGGRNAIRSWPLAYRDWMFERERQLFEKEHENPQQIG